jgi:hypothetical protein
MLFLNEIVIPQFDNIIIKGIKNIKGFFPITAPVLQIVKQSLKSYSQKQIREMPIEQRSEASRSWHLIYNKFRMAATGLSAEKLKLLCETVGIRYVRETPEYMVVIMPEVEKKFSAPNTYIIERLRVNDEVKKQQLQQLKEDGIKYPRIPPTELDRVGTYVYADTNGSNLQQILAMEEVDATRTISNDFHDTARVMGIKVARNMLVKEFLDVLENSGSYINPRHITLLVDYMTNKGIITPLNFNGMIRQSATVLQKISMEQPLKTFTEASGFGRQERVGGSVTASIITGQMPKIGSGMVSVTTDMNKYQQFMKEVMTGTAEPVAPGEIENLEFDIVQAPTDEGEMDVIEAMVKGIEIQPKALNLPSKTEMPPPISQPAPEPVKPTQLARIVPRFSSIRGKLPTDPITITEEVPSPVMTEMPTIIQDIVEPPRATIDIISPPKLEETVATPVSKATVKLPGLSLKQLTKTVPEEKSDTGFISYQEFIQ